MKLLRILACYWLTAVAAVVLATLAATVIRVHAIYAPNPGVPFLSAALCGEMNIDGEPVEVSP